MAVGNYVVSGNLLTGVPVSIANGQSESSVISLKGLVPCMVGLPATFTGTALTFLVCDTEDGTFVPLYNAAGDLVSMTVAQARTYGIDPSLFYGAAFLKIKSGSNESGTRALTVSLRG